MVPNDIYNFPILNHIYKWRWVKCDHLLIDGCCHLSQSITLSSDSHGLGFSNTKTHYVLSVRVIQTLLCNIAHRHGKCICESMLGVIGYIESKILNNT